MCRHDTILDDFMISMLIAEKGYRIVYEPDAYATETASENVSEELKRKIRIAAGGIQSILRLKSLLNPFKNPILSFQYISHRVLRWTITPFLLILVFIVNAAIASEPDATFYEVVLPDKYFFTCLLSSVSLWKRDKYELKCYLFPTIFA